jgi:hypothetical protein
MGHYAYFVMGFEWATGPKCIRGIPCLKRETRGTLVSGLVCFPWDLGHSPVDPA